ncbi:tRNA guanosine-2'-O-methyltransferase TRM11 [Strigomonas culicis]|uniref:tRNA guanosine-2'-O-methyltransferase TRM11 n=1 Tax=Strigomonas culicis TaxID=28005 RepID=S9U241_9TRYP|nr:tRNA guanosine-2'-O-methyltransferase TRM11 [Strigomonas culicis]|eukprot:EPY24852.1 tRNA guanosine-2'-O-methyltransferase TRM11 [Strigomonas culicis]
MPPEESLLMGNFCRVAPGSLVLDPFCGTGSLLVAAAHYGGHTIGADADGRAMRCGTTKGKTSPQLVQQRRLALATYPAHTLARLTLEEQQLPDMLTNFKVYGLCPPDRIRMNFSAWEKSWHPCRMVDGGNQTSPREGFLDAIVTDPPYGLREPRKRIVQDGEGGEASGSVAAYDTHEMVLDLVLFAAASLTVGGYLTFWHPTTDQYQDDELPTHPSMRIITNIPQRVSLKVVRRLVVMRKEEPLPAVRPTRAACAPRRPTENLRKLHDETHLPENKDYTDYRERLERKRAATQKYWQQSGEEPTRRQRVGDRQEEIVLNRENKIRLREEKQKESHKQNALNASKNKTNK